VTEVQRIPFFWYMALRHDVSGMPEVTVQHLSFAAAISNANLTHRWLITKRFGAVAIRK
jgi:hypothetical protein